MAATAILVKADGARFATAVSYAKTKALKAQGDHRGVT
jgi:hypothetical protein